MEEKKTTLGILFFLRKERAKKGKLPIYLRITVDGKRAEYAIKRYIEKTRWNQAAGYGKGNKEEIRKLNQHLDNVRQQVYNAQDRLIKDNEEVTALAIKNKLTGKDRSRKKLLDVFHFHNKLVKDQIGERYAPQTLQRYETTRNHVKEFIEHHYAKNDIYLSELNYEFVSSFDHYLRTVKACNNNTTIKYVKNLKKIILLSIKNEWLFKDPFIKYSSRLSEVKREFLSSEEIEAIENLKITIKRLDLVRDLFIFSCYTGLAYSDLAELTPENITIGIDGEKWIFTKRKKTDTRSNIPLLPKPLEIIEKYKDHPEAVNKGRLLPVPSNQKVNSYLKEIADMAKIKKNLTFHIARHTFATTITLTNDVPIESVSKMLGHKDIRTTQIYAKVVEKKVSEDMKKLRNKLIGEGNSHSKKKRTKDE